MNNIKTSFAATFSTFIILTNSLFAQVPGKGNLGGTRPQMNVGRFYGKVVEEKTNKAVPYTPVQLYQTKYDSTSKSMKMVLVGGQLTEPNGDFSLENLMPMGKYTLKIAALGFTPLEMPVSFDIKMPQPGTPPNMSKMAAALDKDLGNIKLSVSAQQLKAVEIDGSAPSFKLEIDKKVYNVDKNPVNAGGTAQDVMKNVPSVSIDIDGNVTMRNASPQIFVDGRPTTLTLDQIPADAIENIELITNPGAKYDASGGGGGIINIVLKKNRKVGYNGGIRSGVDMRGKVNEGLDLNVREGKINFFFNGNYNQRKSIGYNETDRHNLIGNPLTNVLQTDNSQFDGYFGFGKIGMDYFIDNRNTITIAPTYNQGHFGSIDELRTNTDSLPEKASNKSSYNRNTNTDRTFKNFGGSLLYKHLFAKQGEELTADYNYNRNQFTSASNYNTQYYNFANNPYGNPALQNQNGIGGNYLTTLQTDYVNPLSEKMKIEGGLRASLRRNTNTLDNFVYDYTQSAFISAPIASSNYEYSEQIYAAYTTFSQQINKFSYQAGLRVESSDYYGKIYDTGADFSNKYPLSLFPSGFLSYKFNDNNDIQLNYTRRINRPNFFQLIPFIDYSDSLNLRRGNPTLKPEFTNALEFNYQHVFDRNNSFIATTYFKNTNGLITSYLTNEYNTVLRRNVIITTYENANYGNAYGVEFTSKNTVKGFIDLTSNVNIYNAKINGSNLQANLSNEQLSWFAKLNVNIKMPKNISLQINGDYYSKAVIPAGGGGGRGGVQFGMGPTSTAQGYIKPRYGLDLGLKYDFLKNRAASLIFNVSDVLKTRHFDSYSESAFFTQNTTRYRDQLFFRVMFSYRFGKFDVSLFKRKNNKQAEMDDSQGM